MGLINEYNQVSQQNINLYFNYDQPLAQEFVRHSEQREQQAIKRTLEGGTVSHEKQQRVNTLYTDSRVYRIAKNTSEYEIRAYAEQALERQNFNSFEDLVLALYIQRNGSTTYDECRELLRS